MDDCPSRPVPSYRYAIEVEQALGESQGVVRIGVDHLVAVLGDGAGLRRRAAPERYQSRQQQEISHIQAQGTAKERAACRRLRRPEGCAWEGQKSERKVFFAALLVRDGARQELARIPGDAADAHLVVQMRGGNFAGAAHRAYQLAAADLLAHPHEDARRCA